MQTIQNSSHNPFYNQAFEEFMFQTFQEEVHVAALQRRGIPVVRRMSGGGTVYHNLGNVNYTYITRQDGQLDYDHSLTPAIHALNAIGVPARKNRTCDLAADEGKISDSAQRAAKECVLVS